MQSSQARCNSFACCFVTVLLQQAFQLAGHRRSNAGYSWQIIAGFEAATAAACFPSCVRLVWWLLCVLPLPPA